MQGADRRRIGKEGKKEGDGRSDEGRASRREVKERVWEAERSEGTKRSREKVRSRRGKVGNDLKADRQTEWGARRLFSGWR